MNNTFLVDFVVNINRDVLERVEMHLRSVDLANLMRAECKQNTTLSHYWMENKK